MKKYILSFAVIFLFAGYVVYRQGGNSFAIFNDDEHPPVIAPSSLYSPTPKPSALPPTTSSPPPTTTPLATLSPTLTPKPTATPAGLYRDGSYTGSVADAFYGNVQVKAIIQGGKIADVQFLQYPSDRSTSREINAQAMPYLTQEAIQSQNSNVDIVSGATQTSKAFRVSLASALAQAKN